MPISSQVPTSALALSSAFCLPSQVPRFRCPYFWKPSGPYKSELAGPSASATPSQLYWTSLWIWPIKEHSDAGRRTCPMSGRQREYGDRPHASGPRSRPPGPPPPRPWLLCVLGPPGPRAGPHISSPRPRLAAQGRPMPAAILPSRSSQMGLRLLSAALLLVGSALPDSGRASLPGRTGRGSWREQAGVLGWRAAARGRWKALQALEEGAKATEGSIRSFPSLNSLPCVLPTSVVFEFGSLLFCCPNCLENVQTYAVRLIMTV